MRRALLTVATSLCLACGAVPSPEPPKGAVVATRSDLPVPATAGAPAPRVERRVVVSLSRPSGSSVTTTASDGTIAVALEVLQNGRGPKVDARLALGTDGSVASFEAHGHHEMGTTIDERFSREGDRARWESLEERGDRVAPPGAFFVPMATVPDVMGILTRALLRSNGRLALLPGGEATLARSADATVSAGSQQRHLVGYAISGLDLTPSHVWMNDDGSWFGIVSPWFSVVPEGWEGAIEPLIAKQEASDRARDATNARELAHAPPPGGVAYTHARVLDVERGAWLADRTVVVAGDTIRSVTPSAGAKVPPGAAVVDLTGKALLPGLWDMHVHLGDADGALDIASGVTTVRDVGNDPDKLDDYKKRYDEGQAIGPRVVRFGLIEGRNAKAASSKVTAETEAEADAAVASYAARVYQGIKIYNSVRPELVPRLAREAHARGMAVTGHVPVHMLANEAVRAGYDGVEHVNMLFLNFFATHDTDTRDTTRFTLVGDQAAAFDLSAKPARDFFALLREHHTVIDPTVDAFEDLLVGEQGKIVPGLEEVAARVPVQTARGFLVGGLPRAGKEATYRASFEKLLAMVKALHDAKVPLVVGTDAMAGLMFHHELALYARAGLRNADILRMATLDAARALGMEKKAGSIAPGKAADLIVVDGDPLARIADASHVVSTIRGGVTFDAAAVYATVGVRP